MTLRTVWRTSAAVASLALLAACEADSALTVENPNQPDVTRAFATADGIEAIIRNGFNQILGATHATTNALLPAAMVMSGESYGSVANFGMATRASIPRAPIDNDRGNATQVETLRDFQQLSLRGRTIANALAALDRFIAAGGSLGSEAENLRARSFGFFTLGLANGELALMYDSAGVSTPALASDEVPPLVGYQDAMVVALQQLDSALAYAADANDADDSVFPLETDWLRTPTATEYDDYVRILHSTRARLRAGVARTPAERAAVDWQAVVDDAAAGITSDVVFDMNANEGWSLSWINQAMVFVGWHSMTPYYIGMADTSQAYAGWVALPRAQKTSILIVTPDQRFPRGNTRAEQEASSPAANAELPSVYFRARPAGGDTPGEPWGASPYDFVRFRSYRQNSSIGPWVWFSRVENDMLRAEGLIRLNRDAEAVPLINASRTDAGLPAFPAGADSATRAPAHPGGSATSCVPRTPTGAGNTLECGTLWEAMKWEKRMETAFTGYAQWFIDHRGWGDLVLGTPTMWPVPYQEMDARARPFYSSQQGEGWTAQTSTYGFGVDSR